MQRRIEAAAALSVSLCLGACAMFQSVRGPNTQELLEQGQSAMRSQAYEKAESFFVQIPAGSPEYSKSLLLRGMIATRSGRAAEGLALAKQAAGADPTLKKDEDARYSFLFGQAWIRGMTDSPNAVDELLLTSDMLMTLGERRGAGLTAYDRKTRKALFNVPAEAYASSGRNTAVIVGSGTFTEVKKGSALHLVRIDNATGSETWSQSLGSPDLPVTPVTDGKRVFVPAGRGTREHPYLVLAFDASTGKELWRKPQSATIRHLIVADGMIYFRLRSGNLFALSAEDGKEIFTISLPAADHEDTLVMSGGMAFITSQGRRLYAVDASAKQYERPLERIRWDVAIPVSAAPAVLGEQIILPQGNVVQAYNAQTGTPSWKFEPKLSALSGQASAVPCGDSVLIVYRRALLHLGARGELRGVLTEAGDNTSSWGPYGGLPLCTEDTIYVPAQLGGSGKYSVLELDRVPRESF